MGVFCVTQNEFAPKIERSGISKTFKVFELCAEPLLRKLKSYPEKYKKSGDER